MAKRLNYTASYTNFATRQNTIFQQKLPSAPSVYDQDGHLRYTTTTDISTTFYHDGHLYDQDYYIFGTKTVTTAPKTLSL